MSVTNSILQELLKLDLACPVLSMLQVETIQTWKVSHKTLQIKYVLNALITLVNKDFVPWGKMSVSDVFLDAEFKNVSRISL